MYLTLDIGTPVRSAYLNNKRVQNEFIRNFPTKTIEVVEGVEYVEVFDRLTFYNGSSVNSSASALEIYKLMGATVASLQENDYEGIEEAWMYLKPYQLAPTVITSTEVVNYINSNAVIGE